MTEVSKEAFERLAVEFERSGYGWEARQLRDGYDDWESEIPVALRAIDAALASSSAVRDALEERAAVVRWLRMHGDAICGECEWDTAQRKGFEVVANAIERGDHIGSTE